MNLRKKSTHLFDLIQSLTKGEKRYFKLYTNAFEGKSQTYIKLFEAIEKQKQYNEAALKKKLAKESFIKHFAVAKNQLFNNILKTLRLYHNKDTAAERTARHHDNYLILIKKNLRHIASSELDKAIKIADEAQLLRENIMLLQKRNNILMQTQFNGLSSEEVKSKLDEPLVLCEELVIFHKCLRISQEVDYLIYQKSLRSKKILERIEELSKSPHIQIENKPVTFRAKAFFHHTRGGCAFAIKDYTTYLEESTQIAKVYAQNKLGAASETTSLLINANNILHGAIRVKPLHEVQEQAKKYTHLIEDFHKQNINQIHYERRCFEASLHYKLDYYLFHSQFDKAYQIINEIILELKKIEPHISSPYWILYQYHIAYTYWGVQKNDLAYDYLLKLSNHPHIKHNTAIWSATQLLSLLVHYHNNNIEYLTHQISNTKQNLKRNKYFYAYEEAFLSMLKKLILNNKSNDKQTILNQYEQIFKELKTHKSELDAFEKIDILYWINQEQKKVRQATLKEIA